MGRLRLAMRVLFSKQFANQVQAAIEDPAPKIEQKPAAPPQPAKPKVLRSEAVTLLATLQREARLVDFLQEDITDYSDAQIGAAVRDVHRESHGVLDRLFGLKSVVQQEDGTEVDVPKDPAGRYQLTGQVGEQRPSRGTLMHPGWEVSRCELPQWNGSEKAVTVVAPAEVEV